MCSLNGNIFNLKKRKSQKFVISEGSMTRKIKVMSNNTQKTFETLWERFATYFLLLTTTRKKNVPLGTL